MRSMRIHLFAIVFLAAFLLPVSAAENPFDILLDSVPRMADSVFCFTPSALSSLPEGLLPHRGANLPDSIADSSFHPDAAAFFFHGEEAVGLLLHGALTPDEFRAQGAKDTAMPCDRNGRPCFLLGEDGDVLLAFLGNDVLMLAERKHAELFLSSPAGVSESLRDALNCLPRNSSVWGVCPPNAALVSQPGWSDIARIAFSVAVPEKKSSLPVVSDVLLFPRMPSLAGNVYNTARKQVASAYDAARKKGPVRPEMLYAFLVMPEAGHTKIHITLTKPDAKDFLELIQSYWR